MTVLFHRTIVRRQPTCAPRIRYARTNESGWYRYALRTGLQQKGFTQYRNARANACLSLVVAFQTFYINTPKRFNNLTIEVGIYYLLICGQRGPTWV